MRVTGIGTVFTYTGSGSPFVWIGPSASRPVVSARVQRDPLARDRALGAAPASSGRRRRTCSRGSGSPSAGCPPSGRGCSRRCRPRPAARRAQRQRSAQCGRARGHRSDSSTISRRQRARGADVRQRAIHVGRPRGSSTDRKNASIGARAEILRLEDRVVGLGQLRQREEAHERRPAAQQHRQLEGDRDVRGRTVRRPVADVERPVDHVAEVDHRVRDAARPRSRRTGR